VAATIHAFARDQETVLERVRTDDLEPQRLLASVR
jgi:hypothetical protein